MRRSIVTLCCVALLGGTVSLADGPKVRFLTVVDLTPRSFALAWLSNEPATATLRLFAAPDCASEIFTAEVTPFPTVGDPAAIVAAAQRKGIMLVRVSDLAPDTEYCVRAVTTSTVTGQVSLAPAIPLRVRTERNTTRARADGSGGSIAFGNDLARVEISRPSPDASTTGALVLVNVKGASAPLAGFVGDGITDADVDGGPTGLALVDLNNLYRADTGESMALRGDGSEEIATRTLGGPEGFVSVQARVVPPSRGFAELLALAACLHGTVCDGRLGDADGDGEVTSADATLMRDALVGAGPAAACRACSDVTWDFIDDIRDALAVAQAAALLRALPW